MQMHLSPLILSRLIFALFLGVISSTNIAGDVEDGVTAYLQQDYQSAFIVWNRAAKQGDPDAEYNLGQLYRLGQGVQIDYLTAQSYYIKAAQKGHTLAELNLGTLYYSEKLGPDQEENAFHWLQKAAEDNNAQAQWMIGIMLFNSQGVSQSTTAAYSWLTLASEQQHPQAMLDQAKLKTGLTAKQLDLAETQTNTFQQNKKAMVAIQQQEQDAFYWLHQAAKKGDANAQSMIGDMLLSGQGVPPDMVAAYSWYTLAAEQLHPQAGLKQAQLKSKLSVEQLTLADHLTSNFKLNGSDKASLQSQQGETNIGITVASSDASPIPVNISQQQLLSETQYRVQVGSFKTQQQATTALTDINKISSELLSEQSSTITKPETDSIKPDFYRVQFGSFSDKNAADRLCQQLSDNKQACFVVKVAVKH